MSHRSWVTYPQYNGLDKVREFPHQPCTPARNGKRLKAWAYTSYGWSERVNLPHTITRLEHLFIRKYTAIINYFSASTIRVSDWMRWKNEWNHGYLALFVPFLCDPSMTGSQFLDCYHIVFSQLIADVCAKDVVGLRESSPPHMHLVIYCWFQAVVNIPHPEGLMKENGTTKTDNCKNSSFATTRIPPAGPHYHQWKTKCDRETSHWKLISSANRWFKGPI